MFGVAPEEKGVDVVFTAPEEEEEAATMSESGVTVLASQDLEEANVTSMTEVSQLEDDALPDLNAISHDTQITVENVASEIEEAEEQCQKEDTALLVVCREVLEIDKEAGTLKKINSNQIQIEIIDEKSEEGDTQHEVSLSTHVTSESDDAKNTERAVVKPIKVAQSETPRRRSQRQRKQEETVREETIAQYEGRVLRRTVLSISTPKRKHTKHSQKVDENVEKKDAKVVEEIAVSTTEVVEQLAVTEEVTSIKEDETEKKAELGVDGIVLLGNTTQCPDTAETILFKERGEEKGKESEKQQKYNEVETSVIENKQEVCDDETEEPPVLQRRAFRGRHKVTSKAKPTEQGQRHQKQEEAHTDEADLGERSCASEEKAMDRQSEANQEVEHEETVDRTEEKILIKEVIVMKECTVPGAEEAAEGIIPGAEITMEECKEVQEDEETEGEIQTEDKVIPTEVPDEAVAKEPQEENIVSEVPKLQKAAVILVDLKTSCHHPAVKEAAETPVDGSCAAAEKEQMEMRAAEMLVLEEKEGGEKSVVAAPEAETVEKEELEKDNADKEKEEFVNVDGEKSKAEEAPSIETKDKTAEENNQQQEQDIEADVPLVDDAKDNLSPAEVNEAMSSEGEEEPVTTRTLRSGTKSITAKPRNKTTKDRKQEDEQEADNVTEEEPAVTMRTLRQGCNSVSATPRGKFRRSRKQLQEDGHKGAEKSMSVKDNERPKESAEKDEERDEEALLGSPIKLPTDKDEVKDPEEDKTEVEKEEPDGAEMEKELSEEGTMTITEQEENTAAVTAAAHDLAQEEDRNTLLAKANTDTSVPLPSEEEATATAEDQQNEEMVPQPSELQKVTVVLVDLRNTHHEVQQEKSAVEEGGPAEKAATEVEEEERVETMNEEETMAKESMPGSPVEIENTEPGKVEMEERDFDEKVEDAVRIQDAEKEEAEGTANEDEVNNVDDEEKEPSVTETRTLRSRKQAAKSTPRRRSARSRQKNYEDETEETSEMKEQEVQVSARVLSRGRKSVPVVPKGTPKRKRKQLQEEEGERESTAVEKEAEEEEEKPDEEQETVDEERLEEKAETQQAENTQPEMDSEKEETVAEKADILQNSPEEEQATSTETIADEDPEAPAEQSVDDVAEEAVTTQATLEGEQSTFISEETLITAKDDKEISGSDEEEEPVFETRVLRSGKKRVTATARSKTAQRNEPEEEATGAQSTTEEEPVVEIRVLRKGRRSAVATPRGKSKRARTQVQEEDDTAAAEETEVEEKETGQESLEGKGEKGKELESIKMGMNKDIDVEEGEVESEAGGESAVGDTEQMKGSLTEEVLEKEDKSMAAVNETGTDMVKAEETNFPEEEKTTDTENRTIDIIEDPTFATEEGSDSAVPAEEALVPAESVVTEEEVPAETRALWSKSKTLHATPLRRSRRHKDQGAVEAQQEVENPKDKEAQGKHQLTDDSAENRQMTAEEQVETDETSPPAQKPGSPAEDHAEDQSEPIADLIDDKVLESGVKEPEKEEMNSPEKEHTMSKDDETLDSSVVECRNLRKRKTVGEEEDKTEEIQPPGITFTQKRPRVEKREIDREEKDEETETEAITSEDKDNKEAEYSSNEPKLEEGSTEETVEEMGAVESNSEKEDAINLVLDTTEEVEAAGLSQENEEDEQDMSEEEVEPIVIGKRVLRGRSIPSLIITPQSKSRCQSTKCKKSEESLSDVEKSPQSGQKRRLSKRKSTEVTPARKSKLTAKCKISEYYD